MVVQCNQITHFFCLRFPDESEMTQQHKNAFVFAKVALGKLSSSYDCQS